MYDIQVNHRYIRHTGKSQVHMTYRYKQITGTYDIQVNHRYVRHIGESQVHTTYK